MSKYNLVPTPVTPAERLLAKFRMRLSLPDPNPLYALSSAVTANLLEGPSCWMMLLGPPSCGKSELLNSLLDLPNIVEVADISGDSAFLSGSPKKDFTKESTGGLLRQCGPHGGLVINDFTSILAKGPEKTQMIMAILREVYGGRWTRHIGGEGGRPLHWAGKCAIFGGCTSIIDQYHQTSSELGERWVYFRFDEVDGFQSTWQAISNDGHTEWRKELRNAMVEFLNELDLNFGRSAPHRSLTTPEGLRVHQLAEICARCRSAVTRDPYKKEIIGAREREVSTRLATVFSQLFLAADRIGVPKPWRLLARIMTDSMPLLRKIAITLPATAGVCTIDQLQARMGVSGSVVKRVVEDLELHSVLVHTNGIIKLSEWMLDHNAINIYKGKFGS